MMIPTTWGACFINRKNDMLKIKLFALETDMIRVKTANGFQKNLPLRDVHAQEQRKNFHFLPTHLSAFCIWICIWNQDRM